MKYLVSLTLTLFILYNAYFNGYWRITWAYHSIWLRVYTQRVEEVWSLAVCCSVTKSCLTLCNHMDCSTADFPVLHQFPELTQTCPSSWWFHSTISSSVIPLSSCLQSFPSSGSFPMSQFFASDGQIIGALASTSVLPMNIQDWIP